MTLQLAVIAGLAIMLVSYAVGIGTGILIERIRWNKLIGDGKLPKPLDFYQAQFNSAQPLCSGPAPNLPPCRNAAGKLGWEW